MVDLDDVALEERSRTPRTKAGLDGGVYELTYERRLSMAARRARTYKRGADFPAPL